MESVRINFLGHMVDDLSVEETIAKIEEVIETNSCIVREDLNASKLILMRGSKWLAEAFSQADLINVDGQSIIFASRFLGTPIRHKVSGIDLMERLITCAHHRKYKIYLLGSRPAVVEALASKLVVSHSVELVAGFRHGYFDAIEETEVVADIRNCQPDLVFIGMPSPQREAFISKYKGALSANFIMGVGGAFDVLSGRLSRAPLWMQRCGLEWLFRVYQEPFRLFFRYLKVIPIFSWVVLVEKIRRRRDEDHIPES